MQRPSPSPLKQHWLLEPQTIFLNHGSFGACPRIILDLQQKLRSQLEAQPVRFFTREYEDLLDQARLALADFLHADAEGLAFLPNATQGVNAVLRSFPFQTGDQILITDHGYNACNNAARYVADRCGAEVVVAKLPFPFQDPQQLHEAILQYVTPRTRLALLDHVTSPTALILPLETILPALRDQGVLTLIDGAHAPGMLPLQLKELDADFYTGNCHKWMCAPKGTAFLYVRETQRKDIRPLAISHGENDPRSQRSRFHLRFDWVGSDDPTSYLTLPHLIQEIPRLLGMDWTSLMQDNHQKACLARKTLSDALQLPLLCPDAQLGSMASIPLPARSPNDLSHGLIDPLQQDLFLHHQIEVPIFPCPSKITRLLRVSAQAYNTHEEYQYLAHALLS